MNPITHECDASFKYLSALIKTLIHLCLVSDKQREGVTWGRDLERALVGKVFFPTCRCYHLLSRLSPRGTVREKEGAITAKGIYPIRSP